MKKIFFIAEIGINHNGDISITKELIKLSKDCGFDAVKFQKRTIEKVYSKEILDQYRESPWGKTQRDQKLGLEFDYDEYLEIDNYCKSINIDWFASAWDVDSITILDKFDLKYHKIASPMIFDTNFLAEVAKRK
jgi:N-acetylneuraminate synthase